jgi:hypothetical protein
VSGCYVIFARPILSYDLVLAPHITHNIITSLLLLCIIKVKGARRPVPLCAFDPLLLLMTALPRILTKEFYDDIFHDKKLTACLRIRLPAETSNISMRRLYMSDGSSHPFQASSTMLRWKSSWCGAVLRLRLRSQKDRISENNKKPINQDSR